MFSLIAVAVCSVVFSAALLVPYAEAETADPERVDTVHAEYMKGDVYVDGKLIYGWTMEDPAVVVDGTLYIPLRLAEESVRADVKSTVAAVASAVEGSTIVAFPEAPQEEAEGSAAQQTAATEADALSGADNKADENAAESTGNTVGVIAKLAGEDEQQAAAEDYSFFSLHLEKTPGLIKHDTAGSFNAAAGFKSINGTLLKDSKDLIQSDKGVWYGSEDFLEKSLGIDVYYTDVCGLYISTDPSVSAKRWADSNPNETFIPGVAEYIRVINRRIPEKTALEYSYLFCHVAGQYKTLDPSLIFAVVWTESTFVYNAGTNALGLMQALPKYAAAKGYTRAMLLDPHHNLEYGAYFLDSLIKRFNGNVVSALAAYNMGPARVSGPNHHTGYTNVVTRRQGQLSDWLASKGYGTHFVEQITLIEPEPEAPQQETNGI
ncbi:MAG: transglycosylase SLT domain-containing protein [Firmicutes bacterium]|nr:transglycosylase SLT domain-containing protein [Bacillota bacterium]